MRGVNIENRRLLQGSNELKENNEATVYEKRVAAYTEDTVMLSPLKMPALPENRSKKRLPDVSGSFFNDVVGLWKAKKAKTSAAAEAIVNARIEREAKTLQRRETTAVNAARKAGEAATLACAWDKCGQGCKCPMLFFSSARVPCVIKGLKKCSACSDIKKSVQKYARRGSVRRLLPFANSLFRV